MDISLLPTLQIPDADFLLHLGDGSPEGLPLLQANINRAYDQAGFTIPKFMWRDALGPTQLKIYAECLEVRVGGGEGGGEQWHGGGAGGERGKGRVAGPVGCDRLGPGEAESSGCVEGGSLCI